MIANKTGIARYEPSRRGFGGDYRKRGAWASIIYHTVNGVEYRRAVWQSPNTPEIDLLRSAVNTITVEDE